MGLFSEFIDLPLSAKLCRVLWAGHCAFLRQVRMEHFKKYPYSAKKYKKQYKRRKLRKG